MKSAHKLTPQRATPMANRPMGWLSATLVLLSCSNALAQTGDPQLIERGRQLFLNETFEGNGRTCGTCHPATNNYTLDPAFVRALPRNDPLFIIRSTPELRDLEIRRFLREGTILENVDGFANPGVMRGVPHTWRSGHRGAMVLRAGLATARRATCATSRPARCASTSPGP